MQIQQRHHLPAPWVRCAGFALVLAVGSVWGPVSAGPGDHGQPPAAAESGPGCAAFSELHLTLEQNATDGDSEVVIFAKGGDIGLKSLAVTAPDGRRIVHLRGDPAGIGLREFVFESAEPQDLDAVLASFPQGEYHFFGSTVAGRCLMGVAPLSHQVAPPTALQTPVSGQVVDVGDVLLSWAAVDGVRRYVVELNNENTGAEAIFDVFPPATQIRVPARFLVRGAEYQFAVGAEAADGNISFVELNFSTAR
jgi:hypothetical protein